MTTTDTGPQPDPTPVAGEPQTEAPTIRQLAVEIANLAHKAWWDTSNAEFLFTAIEERAMDIIEAEAQRLTVERLRKAHAFIGGITPDEWATIDKTREAQEHLDALAAALAHPEEEQRPSSDYSLDGPTSDDRDDDGPTKADEAVMDSLTHTHKPHETCDECQRGAAEAASPAALDVERLAEAWFIGIQHRNGLDQKAALSRWSSPDEDMQHMRGIYLDVARIALARLAQQDGTEETRA